MDQYNPVPLITVPTDASSYALKISGPYTWEVLPAGFFVEDPLVVPPDYQPPLEFIPPERPGALPYICPAVHFDGDTVLSIANLFGPSHIPSYMSFSVWCKSKWDGGQTVFSVDPGGVNSPFLKTTPPCLFVVADDAQYDGSGNIVVPMNLFYSTDGVHWPLASFPTFSKAQEPGLQYGNGVWVCIFNYVYGQDGSGDDLVKNICIYSFDGRDWILGMAANENVSTIINATFDSVANTWTFTNGPDSVVLNIPNPPDLLAANLNIIFPQGNADLFNQLPGPFQAVRFNRNASDSYTVDLTVTFITQAIIDSGIDWPAAIWTIALPGPKASFGVRTRTVSYGQPTRSDVNNTGFLVYDYSGIEIRQDVMKSPLSPPNSVGWVHMIGSINLRSGVAVLYINDQFCGTVSNNIRVADPRGKTLYIGGDTFGNNFFGDMADFYLYTSVDFAGGSGFIPEYVRRWFIDDRGAPVNPLSLAGPLEQLKNANGQNVFPSVLCSGRAELIQTDVDFLGFRADRFGVTGNQAQIVQGTLTNASSSPTDILRPPLLVPA